MQFCVFFCCMRRIKALMFLWRRWSWIWHWLWKLIELTTQWESTWWRKAPTVEEVLGKTEFVMFLYFHSWLNRTLNYKKLTPNNLHIINFVIEHFIYFVFLILRFLLNLEKDLFVFTGFHLETRMLCFDV